MYYQLRSSAAPLPYQVQLHDGTTSYWATRYEIKQILESGRGKRIPRKAHQPFEVIRLIKPVEPSTTPVSPCAVTPDEMRMNVQEIECRDSVLDQLHVKIDLFRPLAFEVNRLLNQVEFQMFAQRLECAGYGIHF